ncbi:hypothetical protein P5G51_014215 [Virgibacillus sp. 179-BFC.A HS]|uniref:Exonuclease SbcC n=1 Tax=Tigheibacillus jepli TaxID=3035914 RepID=A0ABU5CKM6_9BACI|nr:hypothetical protein [Virgibacillus sp. 179-BFC.A HS]MDY0406392.1 hypothetical protein [Virgibacillus sp. 179-BFC.A HS]
MQQEAKIQDEKKPERETIGKKLNQYLDLLPIVKDVNQRKQQIASMKKQLESADKELEKTKHSVADKQKAYEELAKKVKQLDEKVSTLPQHQQQLIDMRDQARVLGDYLKAYKHQNALKEELQRASSKLENAKTQYEKVEQAWLSNQASVLAAHLLHEGDACPVCGSIWHGKQTAVAQADVTKEQLQSAKESYQQLERKYHSILADVKYNQNVVEQSVEALKAFNIPTAEADEKYRQLVEAGKKQNQLVEQLKKDAKQLREWKEEQDTKQEIITKLNKNKEQLEQKYHTLKTDHDRSVAVYEEK